MVALGQVLLRQLDPQASAAALLAPLGDAKLPITGTTTITSITAGGRGQLLLLEFASAACQVTNGSNLKLRANYTSAAFGTLLLECDGTNWVEVSRNPIGPLTLTSADFPATLWTTSGPLTAAQTGGITFTVTLARQFTLGKFVNYVCQVTITSVGTVGGVIVFQLPFSWNANAGQAFGTFRYDRAAGVAHSGIVARSTNADNIAFMVPSLGFLGNNPNFATANTDTLWFNVAGETT